MTDETFELLKNTKSVRDFEDRDISTEIVTAILEAACAAPTGGNQQPYTILNITDPHFRHVLSETCDHQPMIEKAKLVLIFCADALKWQQAYEESGAQPREPGPADLFMGVIDATIAAQNAVIAASSFDIGSCYIGDIVENRETVMELLHLPEGVMPACMVIFGYPTQSQIDRVKPARCPLSHIVSENTYPEMDREYRRKLFENKTGRRTYEEWINLMCTRKHNSDFFAEMNRSIRDYMRYYLK